MRPNWPTKKLGEVCNIVYGYAFKADTFNETGKGLPVIRIGDLDKGKTDKFFDRKYDEKYLINRGNVLLGLSGSFKSARWEGNTALLNQRVATLRNFQNDTAESFVFYQMPRLFFQLEKIIAQLSVKNILTKHLENSKVLYPPLQIQKQIVERLDAIKKAQELNDKQIALAEELFQSLLHRELNPQDKNWQTKRLGEVSKVKGGKRVPKGRRLIDTKTNHPYIRVVDFKDFSVDLSNLKYIDDETFKVIKNYTISKDEIYVSIAGTTGLAGIIPAVLDGANLTENAAKLIPKNKDLEKMFLVYFLASDFGQLQLQRSTYAPGIPKLALYRLERIKIPIPPLETQRQIAQKLQAVWDYKKSLLAQKEKLQELFESTLDKSMTP